MPNKANKWDKKWYTPRQGYNDCYFLRCHLRYVRYICGRQSHRNQYEHAKPDGVTKRPTQKSDTARDNTNQLHVTCKRFLVDGESRDYHPYSPVPRSLWTGTRLRGAQQIYRSARRCKAPLCPTSYAPTVQVIREREACSQAKSNYSSAPCGMEWN